MIIDIKWYFKMKEGRQKEKKKKPLCTNGIACEQNFGFH